MGIKHRTKAVVDFLKGPLESDCELTIEEQRIALASLAYSGKFDEPAVSCLLMAAEVVGDTDELLTDMLKDYSLKRREMQRSSEGKP